MNAVSGANVGVGGKGVTVGVLVGAGEGVTVIVEVDGMEVFIVGVVEQELNSKTNIIKTVMKLRLLFFMLLLLVT